MSLEILETDNADLNLTSQVTVLSSTPDAANARLCKAAVNFGDGVKDLDGTGGNFELVVTVGGQTVQPSPQIVIFGPEIRSAVWTSVFGVPANALVVIKALSPNGADTDVDVTAILYDVNDTNVSAISGDTAAADKLELFTENSIGTDNKVLSSTDPQDLPDFAVDAQTLDGEAPNNLGADEITQGGAVISMNGTYPLVDAAMISGDTAAADKLELFTGNAIGTDNKVLSSTDPQDLPDFAVDAQTLDGETPNNLGADEVTQGGTVISMNDSYPQVSLVRINGNTDKVTQLESLVSASLHSNIFVPRLRHCAAAATDIYRAAWDKVSGGTLSPKTSGITNVTIRVFDQAGGTDFIAATPMAATGQPGVFEFTTAGSRLVDGLIYTAELTSNIDIAPRIQQVFISRDSSS